MARKTRSRSRSTPLRKRHTKKTTVKGARKTRRNQRKSKKQCGGFIRGSSVQSFAPYKRCVRK